MTKSVAAALASLVFGILGWISPLAAAEAMSIGQQEYSSSCAACHGIDAKGTGPMAELLSTPVPDLTVLAARNGGVFPLDRVYSIIDGRTEIAWHGSREMPIWGSRYRQMTAEQLSQDMLDQQTINLMVRSRILAIVDYLNTIQQK